MPVPESLSETIGRSGIEAGRVTVAGLSQAMASGQLTSAELTAFYAGRIERLNDELGAVISVSQDAAEQAQAADRAWADHRARADDQARADKQAGADRLASAGDRPGAGEGAGADGPAPAPGPLAGIPVLIKDNIAVDGQPATAGSPALLRAGASDAFLIGRLRAAGAIILGKANLSEWANFRSSASTSGWSTLGGQAVNPFGSGRNPSGSSSGSAVAVAAGLAPLAVGTETDGSIVSPAHACGIVGIKPTLGLVSRTGIVPVSLAQDTAGPMTRCVADAAVLLGALAGQDPADPATGQSSGQPADYTRFLDPDALAGARIGLWREVSAEATPATKAVLDAAVSLLRDQGAKVIDPVELAGTDKLADPEFVALRHEFKDDLNAYLSALDGQHPMTLGELISFNSDNANRVLTHFGQEIFEQAEETGGRTDPVCQEAREQALRLARTALDGALTEHRLDAVVSLTGSPAWLTDYVLGDHYAIHSSSPAAVAGYPSITVPAGRVSGLPVGFSFTGPAWSEPALLALAYSFEQANAAR
ncbi:MAG TPA: amidase [Streptosporangiaceae bacterium]|nr:amidase [Streptosporangiaceae bacterium]